MSSVNLHKEVAVKRRWFSWTVALGSALVLLALPGSLFAQATSGVTGRVLDEQGAAVPGAAVVLRNQESGRFRETVSGSNGSFSITGVNPGLYRLEVNLSGFQGFKRSNLRLVVGTTEVVDVELTIGQVEQTVNVTADAPLVDVSSSEIGGNVTQDELLHIPTIDRSFGDYLDLLPGVVGGDFLGSDQANYMVDGGANNDVTRGGAQARVPIEASGTRADWQSGGRRLQHGRRRDSRGVEERDQRVPRKRALPRHRLAVRAA
jgi:hypothetical protein